MHLSSIWRRGGAAAALAVTQPVGAGPAVLDRRPAKLDRQVASTPGAAGSRALRDWLISAVGYTGLALVVLGAIWLALAAASGDAIVDTAGAVEPSWVAGPLAGLIGGLDDTGFSVALLAMLAGYVALVVCAGRLSARVVLGALVLAAVALTLAPPLLSSDVFGYIGYGRLGALHHLDPYRYGAIAAPGDPILPLIYWQHPTSPYGPLFTWGTYLLAPRSLPVELFTLKAADGLAWLASLALVWRCAGALGRPRLAAAVLLGANPLLLVYGLAGAHNDLLVMACVLGGLMLLAGGRSGSCGAAFAVAVAVKATGGILLPFVLLGSPGRRCRVAAGVAAAGVPLAALTVGVFGTHVFDTLGQIVRGNIFNIDYSGPDLIGRLAGTGITSGVRLICIVGVLAALALSLRAMRRGLHWLTAAGWTTLAGLLAIASFVPWYIAWLLPMGALTNSRNLRVAVLGLSAAIVLTHTPLAGFPAYE